MLDDKTAGIDCINCGHQEVVKTGKKRDEMQDKLTWFIGGCAACPECGQPVMFEDYIDS